MTQADQSRQKQNAQVRMAAGAGLMLVGLAMFFLLRAQPGAAPAASNDLSVVPAAANYPAPSLSLTNLTGERRSLADYRGQVVLVNNWATWCPPCKAEMPTLEAYYEKHAPEGFMIVAVEAGDEEPGVRAFAESHGLQFQVWLDPQHASLSAFRNPNLPNSFVLDRAGTVRYAWTGEISSAMLEKYITPLLGED